MDLTTQYLGFTLPHPLMVGASPLAERLDLVKRAEDAGAAAIVMPSLFEEQLVLEQLHHHHYVDAMAHSHAEAGSFFAVPHGHELGPDEYLNQLRKVKAAVAIPVFASLHGASDHGWLSYARLIEEAGADALELNVYHLALDPALTAADVEASAVAMVRHARAETRLPMAVKLSPAYSSPLHVAQRLAAEGAQGLVLFNRYYEPDIDVEKLELVPRLALSTPSELPVRLRWLGAMFGQVPADLAVTGGVHAGLDALKAVMAGASAVQMVSSLLLRGPEHLATVRAELARLLVEGEYESLAQARGNMSLARCPDPTPYHRGGTVRILQSHRHLLPR